MDTGHMIAIAGIVAPIIIGIVTHQIRLGSATKINTRAIETHINECREDKKELRKELRDDFNRVHDRLDQMTKNENHRAG